MIWNGVVKREAAAGILCTARYRGHTPLALGSTLHSFSSVLFVSVSALFAGSFLESFQTNLKQIK